MRSRGVLLLLTVTSVLPADDWPGWLGPHGDGTSRETGWLKDWPEDGPPRLFEKPIGEGYSGITVAKGHLLLFHRQGGELLLDSLDPGGGSRRWRFAYETDYRDRYGYNGGPRCAPLVTEGAKGPLAIILGPKGVLHALDLSGGSKVYRRDLKKEHDIPDNFFGVGATPLVRDDHLFVHLGGTETGSGTAFCLETATGRTRWKSPTDGGSYAAPTFTRIGDTEHLFVFHRGGLSSLDPASGRERWKFPWRSRRHESVNAATPLVVDDIVFGSASYGTGGFALRVRETKCEVLWKDDPTSREKSLATHWGTAHSIDGHLYGFSGRHESGTTLNCVELETGKVRWRWHSPFGRGSMVYSDGHFLALGERGDLALLRLTPREWTVVKRVPGVLQWPAWTVPTLSGGRLYLRDEHRLIALDLRTSRDERARKEVPSSPKNLVE